MVLSPSKYCLLVICILASWSVRAQCCSGGVPMSGNVGLPATDAGVWQFAINYDVNHIRTLQDNQKTLTDRSRERLTKSWLFQGGYSLSQRWAVDAFLSYVRQERTIRRANLPEDFTFSQGVGDATLLLKHRLATFHEQRSKWWVGVGPKIPLGAADRQDDRGITLIADLQPGSGAWDAVFWSEFVHQPSFRPSMNLSSRLIYRMTGQNDEYLTTQVYEFGNEMQLMASVSDQVLLGTLIMDPGLTLRYRKAWEDRTNDETVPNSGGDFLFIAPGISLQLLPDLALQTRLDVPLFRRVTGTQLVPDFRWNAGVFFRLPGATRSETIPKLFETN